MILEIADITIQAGKNTEFDEARLGEHGNSSAALEESDGTMNEVLAEGTRLLLPSSMIFKTFLGANEAGTNNTEGTRADDNEDDDFVEVIDAELEGNDEIEEREDPD